MNVLGRRRVGARGGGRGELQMLHPKGAVERGAPPVLEGGGGSSAAPMPLIGFEPASRFQSGAGGASSFVWSSSLATEPVSACSGPQQSRVLSAGSEGTAADAFRLNAGPQQSRAHRRDARCCRADLSPRGRCSGVERPSCSLPCREERDRPSPTHAHISRNHASQCRP